MRATDAAGWESFHGRVADLPVSVLFPGASKADGVVLDGFTHGARWGVAFSDKGLGSSSVSVITADLSVGGGGVGVPTTGDLPPVLSVGASPPRRRLHRRSGHRRRGARLASCPTAPRRSTR